MSDKDFPKAFAWSSDPKDVIVFHSADEIVADKSGIKWECEGCEYVAARYTTPTWIRVPPNEQIAARIAYLRTELAVLEALGPTACREDVTA